MKSKRHEDTLFWGILLIVSGGAMLLSNLNIWPDYIDRYLFRWESLLIFIGFLSAFVQKHIVGGIVAIGFGTYFLMDDLYCLPINWEIWFWPVLFLIAGAAIIFSCKKKKGSS